MSKYHYWGHLLRDMLVVVASIVVSILLVRLGVIESFIDATKGSLIASSFIAGAFFTLIFTVVPAGVALVAIGQTFPPVLVAFFGALGAMIVDVLIITFVRKDIVADLDGLSERTLKHHLIKVFHFGFLKWIGFVVGMLFLATPLPDELGLMLIGVSKVRSRMLPLVFFIAHFMGILTIISVANAI
jgi:hypothetical protein